MNIKIRRLLVACLLTLSFQVYSDDPPVPSIVANTISNYWAGSQLDELGTYITNLYTSYSNYVPAVLAKSFYDGIYLGDLAEEKAKLEEVQTFVNSNADSIDDDFEELLQELIAMLSEEINMHQSMGTSEDTLKSNASPANARSSWGDRILPPVYILFYAPAITITNAP